MRLASLLLPVALVACAVSPSADPVAPERAPRVEATAPQMVDIPAHLDIAAVTTPGLYTVKLSEEAAAGLAVDRMGGWTGRAALDSALSSVGADEVRRVHRAGAKRASAGRLGLDRTLRFRSDAGLDAVVASLGGLDGVEWVQPMARGAAQWLPDDDLIVRQWNLAEVNLQDAWDISRGAGVTVAVIDTGVDPTGPDGLANYIGGYDAVRGDLDPTDGNGHGTHVAGTVNQTTDNGRGAAGVAPDATLMAVRALDDSGMGDAGDVADGIVWAVDNGADIINLSLGFGWDARVLRDAVEYAGAEGVLLVAASGNEGYTGTILYPARYDEVIAVGATGRGMSRADYSNEGRQLELMAPGGDGPDGILQEMFSFFWWDYVELEGTSMAAPHVAGIAALVMSAGVDDPATVRALLTSTAVDLGAGGRDNVYGHGFVDALAALEAAGGEPVEPAPLCDGFTYALEGSLSVGAFDLLPNSGYYYRGRAGAHEAVLEGPADADLDLYLYKHDGDDWAVVAFSESYSSSESIAYDGSPGYYHWVVNAYSGSGAYDLCVSIP
ncbi:MAG: subtilisin family serine protease [Myxococcota bacterium]|jgi:subtilisin family serine protease